MSFKKLGTVGVRNENGDRNGAAEESGLGRKREVRKDLDLADKNIPRTVERNLENTSHCPTHLNRAASSFDFIPLCKSVKPSTFDPSSIRKSDAEMERGESSSAGVGLEVQSSCFPVEAESLMFPGSFSRRRGSLCLPRFEALGFDEFSVAGLERKS